MDGEIGWSTFTAREAKSKLIFQNRLINEDKEQNLAAALYYAKNCINISTRWDRRTRFLSTKFTCFQSNLSGETQRTRERQIIYKVNESQVQLWRKETQKMSSLELYYKNKLEMGQTDNIYDNSEKSKILSHARAGVLKTKLYRSRYENIPNPLCDNCKLEIENIQHIVLDCKFLNPIRRTVSLEEALGFEKDGEVNMAEVNVTKNRLLKWFYSSTAQQ